MTLPLEVWLDAPPSTWDETVRKLGGTAFHCAAWAEYLRVSRGLRPAFLLARDGAGDARAAGVAMLRSASRPVVSRLLRDLILPAHPAVD
ncbi:MAG: hypothetical protein ACREJG_01240, partial [Candidatus Rokuibacteriota bacterium]